MRLRHIQSFARQLQRMSTSHGLKPKDSALAERMPTATWDSHMHVTSPDYPLAQTAAYVPSLHNLQHAMAFEKTIGISRIVLVQPSIYGNDNSCLLDALSVVGPVNGRGVVGIDPDCVQSSTLRQWHQLGVRGVRLNLKSTNIQLTEQAFQDLLQRYANVIRPLDWVLELFIGMKDIPLLERIAADLGMRMVIAHFGAPELPHVDKRIHPLDPYQLVGFQSLINLLQKGNTWIKFSAAYRFDQDPEMRGIEAIAREILQKAGERVVFASDWPHTRFEGLDVRPFVDRCLEWTEEAGMTEKVFCSNAQQLWGM